MGNKVIAGELLYKERHNPKVIEKLQSISEDYGVMSQLHIPYFTRFQNSIYHYAKYMKPIIRKSLNTTPLRDLEMGALGLRKCCESIVKMGVAFSINGDRSEYEKMKTFKDKILYLNREHPIWVPRRLDGKIINKRDVDHFYNNDLLGDPVFSEKVTSELHKAEATIDSEIFNPSFLIKSHKYASEFIHYNDMDPFINEHHRHELKNSASQMKECITLMTRPCIFTADNASRDNNIVGIIVCIGDSSGYYHLPIMSARDLIKHLKTEQIEED